MPRPPVPLLGRDEPLQAVLDVVADAEQGRAGAVVLSGDAGVGKTRLLSEVREQVEPRGVLTLIGHCLDFGEAGLAYLPFSEILDQADRGSGPGHEVLSAHPVTAELLPDRRRARSRELSLTEVDQHGRVDRASLLTGVLDALSDLAAETPVLLIIEDVHWADQSSRDLIGFLMTRMSRERLALVVSYRSDDLHRRHPLRPVVAEWGRLPAVRRVDLAPLGASYVAELVRASGPGGQPLTDDVVAEIVARAEGNAFYAEELARAVAADGMPAETGGSGGLPAALADLLLLRLEALTEPGRHVARVAAVAGQQVSHELLAAVADLPQDILETALREALDAQVLRPVGESGYGFRHALLAEAIYDDLLPVERVRLHDGYVRVLSADPSSGAAALLARHARLAHQPLVAVEASVRAAQEALGIGAPDEAMRYFESALDMLPSIAGQLAADARVGTEHDMLSPVRLSAAASDAAAAAGHFERATSLARSALQAQAPIETPGSPAAVGRAELLLQLAAVALYVDADDEALAATEEALRLVPVTPPSALRARVASLHARASMGFGRHVEAERWASEAINVAQLADAPVAASDAHATLALLQQRSGDPDGARSLLQRIIDQSRESDELAAELRGRYLLATLDYETGQLDAALQGFRSTRQRAEQTGRQWGAHGLDARMLLALVHYVRGDWDSSLATAVCSDAAGDSRGVPGLARAALRVVELPVRAGRGELAALDLVPELIPWWRRDAMLAVLSAAPIAELMSFAGDLEGGLARLDEVMTIATEAWQSPHFLARIRLSAVAIGLLADAVGTVGADARPAMVARGERYLTGGHDAIEHGLPAGRHLGVEGIAWSARLEAEWDRLRWAADIDPPASAELIAAWERAIAAFDYGFVFEQARGRGRLAVALRAVGETDRAEREHRAALRVATNLGAAPFLAQLRGGATGARRPTRGGDTDAAALTAREQDVLSLLVDGATNRQIARRLYISEKTVSVHVSNILAKLGVASRVEAAAQARRSGLLDSVQHP